MLLDTDKRRFRQLDTTTWPHSALVLGFSFASIARYVYSFPPRSITRTCTVFFDRALSPSNRFYGSEMEARIHNSLQRMSDRGPTCSE